MQGHVTNSGDAIIRLDKRSTDVLLGKKTPEEIKAIKEARERDRAEKAKLDAEKRAAGDAAIAAKREEIKAQRAEIENADKLLTAALDTFNTAERDVAGSARTREELKVAVDVLRRKLDEAQDAFERAEKRRNDASASYYTAARRLEDLDAGVITKLPNAKDALRAAWAANEAAWAKAGPAKRKAERDRTLKNRVKTVLGLRED